MSTIETENEIKEEVKKEFQLERMILFSDAVFAIVITLMAIEIKMPETTGDHGPLSFDELVSHLAPVILAYVVSFLFIGTIWYQHLKIFAVLKTYDKGLVVRNLALLFCVGLFPFGATVIARNKGSMAAFYIYAGIILLCLVAQFFIHQYILVQKPELRNNSNISKFLVDFHKRKVALITFFTVIVLIAVTNKVITNPDLKPFALLWAAAVPLSMKVFRKK